MTRPRVAILKTSPETILEDYARLMHLAEYQNYLLKDKEIALKINISWHYYYPACSTPPWQLEGVIKTLLDDGYPKENLYACHNRTVVVSAKRGEINNKHLPVVQKYGLRNIHLYENEEWVRYQPRGRIRVLHDIFPDGIKIPKRFIGNSIIHLPTMKTHVFTTMTGAMKNAFGGLLNERRHYTHSVIHETLVDLLTIQKEIHPGIFALMDGTIAGDGPGPRCMFPHIKNYILASADQVAIDAVAAKMMGFDPMELKFIRLAHEAGLGCGDLREIEIVGEDISEVNFHFQKETNTLASKGQKLIYWGPLKPLEKILLRSFITPWSYLASVIFHDYLWHPFIGRKRTKQILKTGWGKLFQKY
ncbi:MAG: DUF362 domain-containing protein [Candidatus Saccharicenans sp.]|uniref:DUF362 domain-containing protein n=1 Tax=Candidatus Saccharicenans sp. TaxID=2819258 RepID=UPI00404A2DC0